MKKGKREGKGGGVAGGERKGREEVKERRGENERLDWHDWVERNML